MFLFLAFASRRRPRGLQIRIHKMQQRQKFISFQMFLFLAFASRRRPRGKKEYKAEAHKQINERGKSK